MIGIMYQLDESCQSQKIVRKRLAEPIQAQPGGKTVFSDIHANLMSSSTVDSQPSSLLKFFQRSKLKLIT